MGPSSGKLFIISAPSGTGKTSLVDALVKSADNLSISVSHTTRAQRNGERDGEHYHFITEAQFKKMIDEQAFLEHALVYGNHYGTSRAWVEKTLASGCNVILEIDWQGAKQIRAKFSESVSIFILPPSRQSLMDRLRARQQDSEEVITKRMQAVNQEVLHYYEFDHLMVNDNFQDALAELRNVIKAGKPLMTKPTEHFQDLVKSLMDY